MVRHVSPTYADGLKRSNKFSVKIKRLKIYTCPIQYFNSVLYFAFLYVKKSTKLIFQPMNAVFHSGKRSSMCPINFYKLLLEIKLFNALIHILIFL